MAGNQKFNSTNIIIFWIKRDVREALCALQISAENSGRILQDECTGLWFMLTYFSCYSLTFQWCYKRCTLLCGFTWKVFGKSVPNHTVSRALKVNSLLRGSAGLKWPFIPAEFDQFDHHSLQHWKGKRITIICHWHHYQYLKKNSNSKKFLLGLFLSSYRMLRVDITCFTRRLHLRLIFWAQVDLYKTQLHLIRHIDSCYSLTCYKLTSFSYGIICYMSMSDLHSPIQ